MTNNTYTCVVCKTEYTDTYEHVEQTQEDAKHVNYALDIIDAHYTIPCFCDGTIARTTINDEGWEIYCTDCLFIYDED